MGKYPFLAEEFLCGRRSKTKVLGLFLAMVVVVMSVGRATEEKTAVAGGAIGAGAGAIIGHQSGHTTEGALIGGYLCGKLRTAETAEGTVVEVVECPRCGTPLQFAVSPEEEPKRLGEIGFLELPTKAASQVERVTAFETRERYCRWVGGAWCERGVSGATHLFSANPAG